MKRAYAIPFIRLANTTLDNIQVSRKWIVSIHYVQGIAGCVFELGDYNGVRKKIDQPVAKKAAGRKCKGFGPGW